MHAKLSHSAALALRNLSHRAADGRPCWCQPIVAGETFPPTCLGQQACRFAREVAERLEGHGHHGEVR